MKLYVDEDGSGVVRKYVGEATSVATSLITYVEARAALARRRHAGALPPTAYRHVLDALDTDWERWARVAITEALMRDAASLAEAHRLRAYDAVHLASAIVVSAGTPSSTVFVSSDDDLDSVAARVGLRVLRPHRR